MIYPSNGSPIPASTLKAITEGSRMGIGVDGSFYAVADDGRIYTGQCIGHEGNVIAQAINCFNRRNDDRKAYIKRLEANQTELSSALVAATPGEPVNYTLAMPDGDHKFSTIYTPPAKDVPLQPMTATEMNAQIAKDKDRGDCMPIEGLMQFPVSPNTVRQMIDYEREEFEASFRPRVSIADGFRCYMDGEYVHHDVQSHWTTWLRARGIEES